MTTKSTRLLIIVRILNQNFDVVDREYAFPSSPQIRSKPPLRIHIVLDGESVTDLEGAILWLGVTVEGDNSSELGLWGRLARLAAWEGRRSRVVVGWWWWIADSHAVERVGRDGSGSSIATRGGAVKRSFGWERAHDSIVDFIADSAILK